MSIAQFKRDEQETNRLAVWDFITKNPCHTQIECCAATGLGRVTVGRHWRAIRDGWRPNTCRECGRSVSRTPGKGWVAPCGRRVTDLTESGGCQSRKSSEGYEVTSRD